MECVTKHYPPCLVGGLLDQTGEDRDGHADCWYDGLLVVVEQIRERVNVGVGVTQHGEGLSESPVVAFQDAGHLTVNANGRYAEITC